MIAASWLLPLAGGILGAIFGSFIGALCSRWPGGRSVMTGRSQCDQCQRTLSAMELIPLLSFILQQGKCRYCSGAVDSDQFGAEMLAALIGAAAFAFLPVEPAAATAIMGWLLLPLIFLDYRHLWLPNRLILLLAVAGPVAGHTLIPGYQLTVQLLAGAGAFAAMELLRHGFKWLRGKEGMGAADPKLFGAIALWLPPLAIPYLLLVASGLGLLMLFLLRSKDAAFSDKMLPFGTMLGIAAIAVQFAVLL
ncbi:prepilin peptidase [Sphingorhabdus arenilitoris]|uniref:Prepilin leader peptidase/N-methyltransferase n=1 Tax=Sphingorhabdus arenilitoris TaxID=1490041 RepID=A0ABV8RHI5_9SPHN